MIIQTSALLCEYISSFSLNLCSVMHYKIYFIMIYWYFVLYVEVLVSAFICDKEADQKKIYL